MSMTARGRLLAAIFSAGLGCAVVANPASAETLAEAIAMAYENNPTLQAQRAAQRALDESYVQARTGWRPTLSLGLPGRSSTRCFATPSRKATAPGRR
jgi:outer membrane protein